MVGRFVPDEWLRVFVVAFDEVSDGRYRSLRRPPLATPMHLKLPQEINDSGDEELVEIGAFLVVRGPTKAISRRAQI